MAYKFDNHQKIEALRTWAQQLQEKLDKVKEAIQDADTMDRWPGILDAIRDKSTANAIDEANEFSRFAHEWTDPYDRFKVSVERYKAAYELAKEVTDDADIVLNHPQLFKVPIWATQRVVRKLKDAGIRHWVNTV